MAKVKPLKFFKRKHVKEETKKEVKKSYFPIISRSIPTFVASLLSASALRTIKLGKRAFLLGFLFSFLLTGIGVTSFDLYDILKEKQKVQQERSDIFAKIAYWEGVVTKYKGYRDGYFQLAVLYYQLGDKEKARKYLGEALKLDPNFEEGRKLEKLF